MVKAIIVDDEPYSCDALSTLVERFCPELKIVEICNSAKEAMKAIADQHPQLVFLDIEMPQMNGFELLNQLPAINFDLIFTTSYDQYAIKAIRFSAIDYLLKPIDREELQFAVKKVLQKAQQPLPQQLEILMQKINRPANSINRIALPTMEGLHLVPVENIISCESSSNYTIFFLKGKDRITVSRTLKEIEEMLEDHSFLRVHHSYLVNLNEVSKYVKGEGGYLVMSDASIVDVSRSRKEFLLQRLQHTRI